MLTKLLMMAVGVAAFGSRDSAERTKRRDLWLFQKRSQECRASDTGRIFARDSAPRALPR